MQCIKLYVNVTGIHIKKPTEYKNLCYMKTPAFSAWAPDELRKWLSPSKPWSSHLEVPYRSHFHYFICLQNVKLSYMVLGFIKACIFKESLFLFISNPLSSHNTSEMILSHTFPHLHRLRSTFASHMPSTVQSVVSFLISQPASYSPSHFLHKYK